MSKALKKAAGIIFWLIIWQAAAMVINRHIILVSPIAAAKRLFELAVIPSFWRTCANSFLRIALGFISGSAAGMLLAVLSCRWEWAKALFSPFMSAVRTIPVASFIILALFWIRSSSLSVLIAMLMVMPIIYESVCKGFESTDTKLIEMADIFGIKELDRCRYIYIPAVMPFMTAAVRTCAALAFKSGTAAEVIGQPDFTLGDMLYRAKLYLETADLFAWTAVIILLGKLLEIISIKLMNALYKRLQIYK